MKKLSIIYNFLIFFIIKQYHSAFNDDKLMDNIFLYLSNTKIKNPNRYRKNPFRNSETRYRCYKGETNFSGDNSHDKIESKNYGCGFEISKIKYKCKNGGLEDIIFLLKKQRKNAFTFRTPNRFNNRNYNNGRNNRRNHRRNNRRNNKRIFFLKNFIHITNILIGSTVKMIYCDRDECQPDLKYLYSHLLYQKKINLITSLEFSLTNNKKLSINCGKSTKYEKKSLTKFQRLSGIKYNFNENYITKLNFFYHSISNVHKYENSSYYSLIKTENKTKRYKRKKGENYIIGPIGKIKGEKFQDLKRYNDWKLISLIIEFNKQNILSIQSNFKNLFFNKNSLGEKFGKLENGKNADKIVFEIPEGNRITKIIFFVDEDENLKGFAIYLLKSHEIFGIGENQIENFKMKEFVISKYEVVMGVLGYFLDNKIVALGFRVSISVLDSLHNFT